MNIPTLRRSDTLAKPVLLALLLFVAPALLAGCGGAGGGTVANGYGDASAVLEGTVTEQAVYLAPSRAPESEPVVADAEVALAVDGESVVTTTDAAGRFRVRLRKRDGSCAVNGEARRGGKRAGFGGAVDGSGGRLGFGGDGLCLATPAAE